MTASVAALLAICIQGWPMTQRSTNFTVYVVASYALGAVLVQQYKYICIGYIPGAGALPDMYARCPRARGARGRVRIYQARHERL